MRGGELKGRGHNCLMLNFGRDEGWGLGGELRD